MNCVCEFMQFHHDVSIVSSKLNQKLMNKIYLSIHELQLKHFWMKLQSTQVYFSICGICRIDRGILTSVSFNNRNTFKKCSIWCETFLFTGSYICYDAPIYFTSISGYKKSPSRNEYLISCNQFNNNHDNFI